MLTLHHDGKYHPIADDSYYRVEKADGMDELTFNMSIYDELYPYISEQENVVDEDGNRYLIKKIDGGSKSAKIVCEIDLDDWREEMHVSYNSDSVTVENLLSSIKPTGWTVRDKSGINIRRTTEGDYTSLEIAQTAIDTYSVYLRFDTANKVVTIYDQTATDPVGAFATRDLNLKEINYKGDSSTFATRLYAYGKDGLTFADINDGKAYVDDNSYSDRIISAYWKDERYEDAESLLSSAKSRLHEMAVPTRSYECSIIDLQATNPEKYNNLDFSLFTSALLVDDAKNQSVAYQVVEREIHPNYPTENVVTFSSAAPKLTKSITQIADEVQNPNSSFNQEKQVAMEAATKWLTNGKGYIVAKKDSDGNWTDIFCMDTQDEATAKDVLRINTNGIGFSHNGINGPFESAWTIDGSFVADYITSGTLRANLIKAGILSDTQGNTSWNLETGALTSKKFSLTTNNLKITEDGTITATNGTFSGKVAATSGSIGGFTLSSKALYFNKSGLGTSKGNGLYIGTDGLSFGNNSEWGGSPVFTLGGDSSYKWAMVSSLRFYRKNGNSCGAFGWESESGNDWLGWNRNLHVSGHLTANDYNDHSDARLKQDVEDLPQDESIALIMGLHPRRFRYKEYPDKLHHGFVAQEMIPVLQDEALVGKTGEYYTVNYNNIIADLVNVIQSMEERISKLEEALNANT